MTAHVPSLAGAEWLCAPETQAVLGCLTSSGVDARVVGGAVRNALLGLPVTEIDIATTATPAETIAAAAVAGLKTVATGLAHGTITVIAGGAPFEVTTLRRDVETDGRHATVAFTDDWLADASRRDFTINALYCDAAGTLFDPLGGLSDLRAHRVRFIGDATQRIREDYLRILRFFRFTATYADGAPDETGIQACVRERSGLPGLSAERVQTEFFKLVCAPRASMVIEAMASHGLLTMILPFAPRIGAFNRLCRLENELGHRPSGALRIAALTVAVDEDLPRLSMRLRLSGSDRTVISDATSGTLLSPAFSASAQRAELYRRGGSSFEARVLMAWAYSGAAPTDPAWRNLIELPHRWQPPVPPYSGRDLLKRGLSPGPRVGQILKAFETWWIGADFPSDTVVLESALQDCIAGNGSS